jgi:hypothetical protein
MNIYLNINDVNDSSRNIDVCDNIRYLYPKKNTIMEGEFTKILYSKDYVTLNGLYLYLPMSLEKNNNYENHVRYILNTSNNTILLQDLKNLETNILNNFKIYSKKNKSLELVLAKQLNTGCIRVYNDHKNKKKNRYVIKISGIWETDQKIGLTFKILEL